MTGQIGEERVISYQLAWSGNTMVYLMKTDQSPTKNLPDGLMTQADAQNGFAGGVCLDDL